MNRKISVQILICGLAIISVGILIFHVYQYSIPIGCNNVSMTVGCARVDELGKIEWTDGCADDTLWDIDSRWQLNKFAKLLRSLKLSKINELPTDIQLVKFSYELADYNKHHELKYMYVAYDFYTAKLYANKNDTWYLMEENPDLNRVIVSRMDSFWFGEWRGQSTYCWEEYPEDDFENATFRYNLYWKKSDFPNIEEHGLRLSGFKNTDEKAITSRDEAIARAAKELGYDNPVAVTFYDETCRYYMVELANDAGDGLHRVPGIADIAEPIYTVIMNSDGQTLEIYEDATRTHPFWSVAK